MVIILRNINNGSVFYLLNKENLLVGRKECDILIQNDQSISRKHAEIHIKDNKLTVVDLGSKYKTFYQTKELAPNVEISLKINEEIQFGVMTSAYKIEELSYVTTSTCLSNNDKVQLRNQLVAVGGKYEESWTPQCTHLTTKKMNLTVKVLHALLEQKFIVTPDFWTKFAENVSKNLPPPKEEDYKDLTVTEPLLNSVNLNANPVRNKLFQGKTFIFLKEKNKKQMEDIINKAGGTSKSWEKNKMPIKDVIGVKKFVIVQVPLQEDDDSFKDLIQHLKEKGKRTIPLQELAMAILTCDTERCCNPDFKIVEEVFVTGPSRLPTQNPLAPNTQSEFFAIPEHVQEQENNTKFIIPDTFDNQMDVSVLKTDKSLDKSKAVDKADIANKTNTNNNVEQSVKRVTNDTCDKNPFKKLKLEKQSDNIKQEKEMAFKKSLEKPTVSRETSQESCGYYSKDTLTSKKRKAEEPLELKGNINQNNPFAVIAKKDIKEPSSHRNLTKANPFTSMEKSKQPSPKVSEDNTFLSLKRKKTETVTIKPSPKRSSGTTVASSTPPTLATRTQPIVLPTLARERSWDIDDDDMWCSKSADTNKNNKKLEDSEMQEYIDMFKDKIIIDILKVIPRKAKAKDVTDGSNSSLEKNYKKFKKVKPLNPQRTIISKDTFIAVCPKNTTGICDSRREGYDSDEEVRTSVQQSKQTKKLFF